MLGRVIGGQPPVVAREDARAEGQKCRGYVGSRFVRFNNYVLAKSWIDICWNFVPLCLISFNLISSC